MADKKYVEEHIKATVKMMSRLENQSVARKESEKIELRRLVTDAAQVFGIADVDGWLKELGVDVA